MIPWTDRLLASYRRSGLRGYTRLHRLLKANSPSLLAPTRYGSRFELHPYDIVDDRVLLEGFYESEVLDALRPELSISGTVLWVIGANFGLHAITAKFLCPSARVIAFEPHPAMAARLMQNASLNGLEIELHTYALAEKDGILNFHANSSGNPGMSTLHPVPGSAYEHQFHVAIHSPKSLIDSGILPPPHLLLIDAEGAEVDILIGFAEHLHSPTLKKVVFEAPNELIVTQEPADIHHCITSAGFRLTPLARNEQTAHSLSNFLAERPTTEPA